MKRIAAWMLMLALALCLPAFAEATVKPEDERMEPVYTFDLTVNGKHEVVSLTIAPDAVDPEDVEMLQDMVIAAVNEAVRAAMEDMSSSMGKITGGMNLPF